jgi:hypothetical protein
LPQVGLDRGCIESGQGIGTGLALRLSRLGPSWLIRQEAIPSFSAVPLHQDCVELPGFGYRPGFPPGSTTQWAGQLSCESC